MSVSAAVASGLLNEFSQWQPLPALLPACLPAARIEIAAAAAYVAALEAVSERESAITCYPLCHTPAMNQ